MSLKWRSTTILAVRRGNKVVLCGDGQVSFGNSVIKSTSQKVKRIADGKILVGYAGSASDGMALLERLEMKLNQYSSQLMRACIELAKDWRTDRYLRRLEAMIIVADVKNTFIVTGSGDVLEPEYGVAGIGSGGSYAIAAARAMIDIEGLDLVDIAHKAMNIAASICVFTNNNLVTEVLDGDTLTSQSKKDCQLATIEKSEIQTYVNAENIDKDDIYSVTAVIASLSKEISVEYVVGIIRSVYPKLTAITSKTKQQIKQLVNIGVLKKKAKDPNVFLSNVLGLEELKKYNIDFSKINGDAVNKIRTLVNKQDQDGDAR